MNYLFDIILNSLNAGLMVYTFMLFFSSFAQQRLKPALHFSVASIIIVIFTILLFLLDNGILKTVILIGITICISQLYKLKLISSILLSLVVFSIGSLAEFVTTIFISILFSVNTQEALEGQFYVLGVIISKFITIIPIILIKTKRQKNHYGTSIKKIFTLLLIPVSTIVTLSFYSILTNQVPIQSSALHMASLLCYAVLTVSNIVLFDLIDHIYRDAEKDKQLSLAKELVHTQENQYQQLLSHNAAVLKIRHDQKNFLIGLLSELDKENYDTIKQSLLDEYNLLVSPSLLNNGNSIVDAVVQSKSELAAHDGIVIDGIYQHIHKITISSIDLAILLGNALDNAIEATKRVKGGDKKIKLTVKVHNAHILIAIKNPVSEPVDVNNLVSTKRGDGSKGFGILSMRNIAAKYSGEVILNCNNNIFETHIILSNNSND